MSPVILVAGGTGTLGGLAVDALRARGTAVRVLTRDAGKAERPPRDGVEWILGDLRHPETLYPALDGVSALVCTAHGTRGSGASGPKAVDGAGVANLIEAARRARLESFVYVSTASAAADSPADIFRYKAQAEERLKASGLSCTIVQPTHLMDTWARLLGEALVVKSQRMVSGSGENPISFVAGSDVAEALAALATAPPRRRTLTLGGPEALTLKEVLDLLEGEFGGGDARTMRIPVPVLSVMSTLARPFSQVRAREMRLGALLDTRPQAVDSRAAWTELGIQPQTLSQWLEANHDALALAWGRQPDSAAPGSGAADSTTLEGV